jgi:hypothetical protein
MGKGSVMAEVSVMRDRSTMSIPVRRNRRSSAYFSNGRSGTEINVSKSMSHSGACAEVAHRGGSAEIDMSKAMVGYGWGSAVKHVKMGCRGTGCGNGRGGTVHIKGNASSMHIEVWGVVEGGSGYSATVRSDSRDVVRGCMVCAYI